jgi:sRNA-binding regulator protein Hfq
MNNATNSTQQKPMNKSTFVAKGHDAKLKALQDSGELITIMKTSGDIVTGRISARDRYSISIQVDGVTRTIYKHAIEEFSSK